MRISGLFSIEASSKSIPLQSCQPNVILFGGFVHTPIWPARFRFLDFEQSLYEIGEDRGVAVVVIPQFKHFDDVITFVHGGINFGCEKHPFDDVFFI